MGKPFEAKWVERFVGHCDSCGLSSKGGGIQSGPATTICEACAAGVARVVAERGQTQRETFATGPVHIDRDGVPFPTPAATEPAAPPAIEAPPSATRTKRARKRAA